MATIQPSACSMMIISSKSVRPPVPHTPTASLNCRNYLERVRNHDPLAFYTAITQNHLPSAGGSLLHPHLQINADRVASNHHRFLKKKTDQFHRDTGRELFSVYLDHEKEEGDTLHRPDRPLGMDGGLCTGRIFRNLGYSTRRPFTGKISVTSMGGSGNRDHQHPEILPQHRPQRL